MGADSGLAQASADGQRVSIASFPASGPLRFGIPFHPSIKKFFLVLLSALFVYLPVFSGKAIAAPPTSKSTTQRVQNPNVIFGKGLLTVQAKAVRLQTLMEAIGKEAGIEVSLSDSIQQKSIFLLISTLISLSHPGVFA